MYGRKNAFTLVELPIVVAIIGILAPALTPVPVEQLPILANPEAAGITPLTGDVNLWADGGGLDRWWPPCADTLSNGNAIVLGVRRYGTSVYNFKSLDRIEIFSPLGELLEPDRTAFFTNAGEPWDDTIGSVGWHSLCSDTVGGRSEDRYVVVTLANPRAFPEAFPDYPPVASYEDHPVVQVVGNDGVPQTPLINVFGDYISQRGSIRPGMIRFLSNGNIVMNFEDRTVNGAAKEELYGSTEYLGRVVGAVILSPEGSIVKPPFAICNPRGKVNSEVFWGLTSGDGWFVIRYKDALDGPTIVAFDNDGYELGGGNGRLFPAIDIPELQGGGPRMGRGDPNGLEAVGDTLYITHAGADVSGYLTKFRVGENGVTVLKTVEFTDHPESTFDHNANVGVDSAGNVTVMWQDHSWDRFQTDRWEMLARVFDKDLEPLTPSFCIFEVGNNTDIDDIDPVLGRAERYMPESP